MKIIVRKHFVRLRSYINWPKFPSVHSNMDEVDYEDIKDKMIDKTDSEF